MIAWMRRFDAAAQRLVDWAVIRLIRRGVPKSLQYLLVAALWSLFLVTTMWQNLSNDGLPQRLFTAVVFGTIAVWTTHGHYHHILRSEASNGTWSTAGLFFASVPKVLGWIWLLTEILRATIATSTHGAGWGCCLCYLLSYYILCAPNKAPPELLSMPTRLKPVPAC